MMEEEKRILTELLQLYRDFPCLWDQTHLLYNNREAREQAYGVLLEKYKGIREDATLEIVKKKLENMRTTYKRERKKVLAAKINGEHEHRPTLWYYKCFTFLDNCGEYSGSETNISENDDHEKELQEIYHCDFEDEDEPKPKKSRVSAVYLREQRNMEDRQNVFNDNINSHTFTNDNSETEAFGKSVGLQLRELKPIQRTIAEKLISDVIFHGRINALTVKSSININVNP